MQGRGQRFVLLAAAIAPAALPLFVIWRYGVNTPYMDEWSFLRDLLLANEQNRLLPHLLSQFNESRPALSRLLFLALIKLSGGDFRAPMLASWLTACLTAWNLWRLARPNTGDVLHLAAMAFAHLIIFSPIQYETWLWGNQVIVLLPMLWLTSALRILQSPLAPWVSLSAALTLGAAAMYTFSGGVFVLPAIAAALVFVWPHWNTHKIAATVCWLLVFALCAGFYFRGYASPPHHPGLSVALQSPLNTVRYFVAFLGSVHCNGEPFVAVLAGLALLATFAFLLIRHRPENRPGQIVVGFILVSAAVTAMGRVGFGLEQALSIRYLSVSLYLTVGIVILALHSAPRILLALFTGALAATSIHGCIRGLVLSSEDYRTRQFGRACVSMSMHTIAGCDKFAPYPNWDFLRITAPTMERLGLFEPGLFAGDIPPGGEAQGTLTVSPDALRGNVTPAAGEQIHAILIAYRHEESVRWLGTALPAKPVNGVVAWESRLRIPAAAAEVFSYRYNADTGKATFVAKAEAH